ncbi:MAG: gliding motility-associated C-terminal domain-containing protein, partial [Cryomorphaceae bacterium]
PIFNEYTFPVVTTDVTIDCATDLVEIAGSASGGVPPYLYEWALPDSTTIVATGPSTMVEPPPPGQSETYILVVTDGCGLSPEYASVTVTNNVQPGPFVNTSPNDTINCVGQTVNLTATGTDGQGDLSYQWNTGPTTPQITVAPDGTQTITWYLVSVTDECGVVATDSVAVYFIPLEAPTALPGDEVTVLCAGDEVVLTGNAEGGAAPYQYQWTGFDPGQSITVNPLVTTEYFLQVTDDCGGTSEFASVTVVVPEYDPLEVSLPEPTSVCPGDAQTLNASVSGGAGGFIYEWDTGENTPSITVSPNQTEIYTVTVTDICDVTTTATTTVTVPILLPIEASAASKPLCTGLSVTLSVTEVSGGAGENPQDYSYAWEGPATFGNISAVGTVTANDAEEGVFEVTITDVCGNSTVVEVPSSLSSVDEIPNVITPNRDGINDVWVVPNSTVFSTVVTILDRWGKVVYESDNYRCDVNTRQVCWGAEDQRGDVYYYLLDIDNGLCKFQGTIHVLDNW